MTASANSLPAITGFYFPSAYGDLDGRAGCLLLSAIFCVGSEGSVKIVPSKVRYLCSYNRFPPKF